MHIGARDSDTAARVIRFVLYLILTSSFSDATAAMVLSLQPASTTMISTRDLSCAATHSNQSSSMHHKRQQQYTSSDVAKTLTHKVNTKTYHTSAG